MEYRGKHYSVILTIGGKWKWSAEIEGQYRKLNVRRALTPPANPRERADLWATSPAERCLTSWIDVMRADDPL